ncbi:DEAD/DEAH box helicase [Rhizobium phaseoli]|uniref:DEAD/DEAH box helicase n=1 Tax=Rhizobium phaseoli TaxID=396 RepID=UPI00031CA59D|nr:DEAD/DEAH box helicase [Rhizobium phaseoli]KKZ86596.1 putative helicase [Rhizobium phaseoli Ch24-10]
MKPFSTLSDIRARSAEAIISQSGVRNIALVAQLRAMFNSPSTSEGGLLQQPIIEGAHPFVPADVDMGGVEASVLHPDFVSAIDALPDGSDYRFPRTRLPFKHQLQAWKHLSPGGAPQSVLVTSGTGSGKTECFLFPILSDLVSQAKGRSAPLEGVQAIMLYPLNALIESQRERLSAWTRPFGGQVRYCLYNGDLPNSQPASLRRATPEQQIDREQLRESPPPVLVTNITMLEYMLARSEDQPIIEKSKGKLKWIVLDEAHSLVGAAAAEIALLLRRVLLAFDCKPEDVHFVATSATIGSGDDVQKQLKRFLADVAGIADANVHVVEGKRQLPSRPTKRAKLPPASTLNTLSSSALFEAMSTDDAVWNFIEKQLFATPQQLTEFERVAGTLGLEAGDFLTFLSHAVRPHPKTGEDERLAPMRIHSFERAVPGVWSCVNPTCKGSPEGWSFGKLFLDRCDTCPTCSAPVLEVISCVDCGEVVLEAEEDAANDRILPTRRVADKDEFEFEAGRENDVPDADEYADDETKEHDVAIRRKILLGPATSGRFRPLHLSTSKWTVEPTSTTETITVGSDLKGDACPCCGSPSRGGIDRLLRPLRFGAPFMIANAAPILLEGVDPAKNSPALPSGGRRLLSFTDSRQGTARMSAKVQAEAERNFLRSFVYHSVQHSMQSGTAVDTEGLEAQIKALETALAATPIAALQTMLDAAKKKLADSSGPNMSGIAWSEMVERLSRTSEVSDWVKDVWKPRDDDALFHDSVKLADFLLMREFARRPRTALSVETLGMARLRFKEVDGVMTMPPCFTRYGKSIEDWRSFLYAIATFFLRANAAVDVQQGLMRWITPRAKLKALLGPGQKTEGDRRMRAWPGVPNNAANMSTPQILLINGLGLDVSNAEHRADILECFDRAWQQLQPVFNADPTHRSLDIRKAYIAPVSDAYLCPLTRRVLDTAPFGISPMVRAARHGDRRQVERIQLPLHPRPLIGSTDLEADRKLTKDWLEQSERITSLRTQGVWNNIADRVAMFADYARSAEHSAQQDSALLRRYEKMFKDGEINILNCSTTMEMGVDIGSVSTVMMTNVPPSVASYKQRVGRAGRRGQPFSLAFTFCRDRPLDREAFTSPVSYLNRSMAAPRVALSSRPIVQRHVNAYLLRRFMVERGGDPIRMTIGAFMGTPAKLGEPRLLVNERPVAMFKEWLAAPTTATVVAADLEKLVRHSVLEGETLLTEASRAIVDELQGNFENEWDGLLALARDEGMNDAGKSRMGMELKRLCDEFLLSALADRGFLPGHGFPTGVVTFLPHKHKSDQPADGGRMKRLSGPQRSLDLAIRDYAPGSEIVLDGLVHKSAGILLNWKRPASEEHIRDVQSLKFHWSCDRCGTTDTSRTRMSDCPICAATVWNRPYIRPAGFSVDVRDKVHAETDIISYVAPEEPSVSVRASPWISLPIPDLGRFRSSREGAVYYSNRGPAKNGYALCLHCGRAAPDHATMDNGEVDQTVTSPLSQHAPLRWKTGEDASRCQGNDNAWAVRRNLELGYEIATDVFELQPSVPLKKAAATALVIAMREGIARILGIEADEMGFATRTSEGLLAQHARSMLIFDRAAGGAGFSASIATRFPAVLAEARRVLECRNPGCVTGCAACVLVSDAPFEEGSLDRSSALRFLTNHLTFHNPLADEDRLSSDAAVSISVVDEVERKLRDAVRPTVYVFLPETTDAGLLGEWSATAYLDRWRFLGNDVIFVVPEGFVSKCDTAGRLALYDLGQRFAKGGSNPVHAGRSMEFNGLAAGIIVATQSGSTVWATRDPSTWEAGPTWSQPMSAPIVHGTVVVELRTSPLERSSLLPASSSHFERITGELDRGLALFGGGMSTKIKARLESVGIPKSLKIETVAYSDPYIKSPLVAKMFVDTVSGLLKGSTGATVELSTNAPGGKLGVPFRIYDDWRDSAEAEAVMDEYAKLKGVDLKVRFGQVPHGRYMTIKFKGGVSATIVFDQGFGAWRTTSSGNLISFDFRVSAKRQAEALARSTVSVAKAGFGPTYMVASKDN